MMALMGFSGFGSTANQHVPGNSEVGAVHVQEQRKYRQYMNRSGGFNRCVFTVSLARIQGRLTVCVCVCVCAMTVHWTS